MFKIECGECRKKQIQDAYGKFIAHVAEKHPELMGQDYRWESKYIIYEAVKNEPS